MRCKRAIFNAVVCLFGYISGVIVFWAIMQLLPYQWAKDVELNYIPPLMIDKDDDYSKVNEIERHVRILCWAFVTNKSDEMREKFGHIAVTWGQKCTTLLFISDGKRVENFLRKLDNQIFFLR